MLEFDKRNLQIIKYIRKHKKDGVKWEILQKKFGRDDANIFFLEALARELFVVTKNSKGEWITFDEKDINRDSQFVAFATPKAHAMIESKNFDFFKWVIPTIISLSALITSIIALLVVIYK